MTNEEIVPAGLENIVVRPATGADMDAVQNIYAYYVLHSAASFEIIPPAAPELADRRQASLQLGLPYLVAEQQGGEIVGYCYASTYRPRPAYRYTIEDSVYISPTYLGQGIGHLLLSSLIRECEATDRWRQMITVIGDSANHGSIALHRRLGFEQIGRIRSAGFKFDRWVNSVLMQRALNGGDFNPPAQVTGS